MNNQEYDTIELSDIESSSSRPITLDDSISYQNTPVIITANHASPWNSCSQFLTSQPNRFYKASVVGAVGSGVCTASFFLNAILLPESLINIAKISISSAVGGAIAFGLLGYLNSYIQVDLLDVDIIRHDRWFNLDSLESCFKIAMFDLLVLSSCKIGAQVIGVDKTLGSEDSVVGMLITFFLFDRMFMARPNIQRQEIAFNAEPNMAL